MAVWTLGIAGKSGLGTTTFLGAAGPADIPSLRVEVSFTAAPNANPVWQDISQYVRSGSLRRGRQRELDKFQAGTCSLVLDNRTRTFDPSYSAGPYFGNIKPMKRIRIYAIYNFVTYPLFDGYVDNWAQQFENPKEARCYLTATDGFKVLAIQTLPSSAYVLEVTADNPLAWWKLGEASGTIAFDVENIRNATYVASPTLGQTGLVTNEAGTSVNFPASSTNRVEFSPNVVTSFPFTIEAIVKIPTQTSNFRMIYDEEFSNNSALFASVWFAADDNTFGNAGKPTCEFRKTGGVTDRAVFGTNRIDDNLAHHVAIVAASGTSTLIYVDGVDVTNVRVNGTAVFPTGGFKTCIGNVPLGATLFATDGFLQEVAVYNTALSAARISAHSKAFSAPWTGDLSGARIIRILNAVNWSVSDRNIGTGLSALQAASISAQSVLTHAQLIEQTEAGLLFISKDGAVTFIDRTNRYNTPTSLTTFGDSGSDIGYQTFAYDVQDQPISNDVRVTRTGGSEQSAQDATSISDYYTRTLSIAGLLHQTDTISQARAQFEVANRKDLLERVTMLEVLPMASPATYFPAVLARELHDSVTVKRLPQGVGSSNTQLSVIEGIQHEFAPRHWKANFYVSPVSGIATDGTSVSKQYWVLGIAGASELGQTTRLGF